MKLRGIKPINDCIERFLAQWDLTAEINTDFLYNYFEEKVYWSLLVSEQNDKDFKEFFESLGCEVKADIFIYSLLHEVGHSQTLDDISEKDYNYSLDRKAEKLNNIEYFNLPVELAATQWAVDYLNTHSAEVEKFWNELQPLLIGFYKKNHIV